MGPEIICTKIYFVCIHRPRFLDRSLARIIFHIRSWSVSKCLQNCYASNWSPNLRAMANHSKTKHWKQKVRKTSLHFQDLPIQSFQPAVLPSKLRKCSNYPVAMHIMHGGFALWTWCCCCYFVDFCILLCFLIFPSFRVGVHVPKCWSECVPNEDRHFAEVLLGRQFGHLKSWKRRFSGIIHLKCKKRWAMSLAALASKTLGNLSRPVGKATPSEPFPVAPLKPGISVGKNWMLQKFTFHPKVTRFGWCSTLMWSFG